VSPPTSLWKGEGRSRCACWSAVGWAYIPQQRGGAPSRVDEVGGGEGSGGGRRRKDERISTVMGFDV